MGTAGQLRFDGNIIEGETNGDAIADLTIVVNGLALTQVDILFG